MITSRRRLSLEILCNRLVGGPSGTNLTADGCIFGGDRVFRVLGILTTDADSFLE